MKKILCLLSTIVLITSCEPKVAIEDCPGEYLGSYYTIVPFETSKIQEGALKTVLEVGSDNTVNLYFDPYLPMLPTSIHNIQANVNYFRPYNMILSNDTLSGHISIINSRLSMSFSYDFWDTILLFSGYLHK